MPESVYMRRLRVTAAQDHLLQQVKTPRHGLLELIWNALDADATEVDITVERSGLGGVSGLTIADDGTGITLQRAELSLDKLGDSWKATERTSVGGRPLHGRHGRGRWAAFGIGRLVTWTSVADSATGERERIRVYGDRDDLSGFGLEDQPDPADGNPTGTTVTISTLTKPAESYLDGQGAVLDITTAFAPYIEAYGVRIVFDRQLIDPKLLQEREHSVVVPVPGTGERMILRIIEWTKPVDRTLYFVDSKGAVLYDMRPGVQVPGFVFTAYVEWAGAREHHSYLTLEENAPEPVPSVIKAAKQAIRDYFTKRDQENRQSLVEAWKKEKTYPFKGEPGTAVERVERELFDTVAITAVPAIAKMEQRERRLSFALIQQALTQSPQAVYSILHDVLEMPEKELRDLTSLLERTSLSSIVSMAKTVSDRLDFIAGLEHLIFDKQTRKVVKERSQLHKILAKETWILREEYALTVNDQSLTAALRDHLRSFGRDDVTMADTADEVLDAEGKRVVVDLILSSVVPQTESSRQHLVIELKRPTVHINDEGLLQANKYAVAVKKDARFERVEVSWEFWIIGDSITEEARNLLDEDGYLTASTRSGNLPIRAVTWAQVIEAAKHRMKFVQHGLEIEPTKEDGIARLRASHEAALPDDLKSARQERAEAVEGLVGLAESSAPPAAG